ncbi:MAG: glycosyltransferase, partial [Pseudomonadales bacterium]|nr:glycosyltransferase [Pseudomonadales bacterium]
MKKRVSSTIPKISIIIPIYNAEKYLAQTLDSVILQDF